MTLHLPRPLPPLLSCLSLSSVVTHSYHSYPPLVCCQLHLTRARARVLTCAHALGWSLQVRVTNVLNTLMQCFSIVCLITVEWMCFGYSLGLSPSPVCCSLALARSRSLPGLQHSLISPSPVCRSLSPHAVRLTPKTPTLETLEAPTQLPEPQCCYTLHAKRVVP